MPNSILLLVARVLFAIIFIMAGVGKFAAIGGTAGYIASVGLPAATALAWLAAIFETVAGIAILVGFRTKETAVLLALFSVFTGFVFHFHPDDQMQMVSLMKNLAIAGGFLSLFITGPGALSVDARLRGTVPAAA